MALNEDLRALEGAARNVDALGDALNRASESATKLRQETRAVGVDARRLARDFSADFGRAFDAALFRGGKLSDMMRGLALDLSRTAAQSALRPVQDALGAGVANVVSGALGGATLFARGGVVGAPTAFTYPGGLGVMGEAGPEAIVPLKRGPDGNLGVAAAQSSGAPASVIVNISTPDAASFQRSRGQISAQIARAVDRGRRNQ